MYVGALVKIRGCIGEDTQSSRNAALAYVIVHPSFIQTWAHEVVMHGCVGEDRQSSRNVAPA